MMFGSISLFEGLNTSGAFNFFVDSGDKYLMSIHPKKVGKTGRLSQKVRGFSPLMICSIIGKYDSLAVIKWSKHCPMPQLSAFGFQLSCCAVKLPMFVALRQRYHPPLQSSLINRHLIYSSLPR